MVHNDMTRTVFVAEKATGSFDAGPKARDDVSAILSKNGWEPIYVSRTWGAENVADKLKAARRCAADWREIARALTEGDILLIQYPLAVNPQIARVALPRIERMRRRGVNIIYFIHDLDSFRGLSVNIERRFLVLGDVAIAHNERMRDYVRDAYGIPAVSLDVFDYLLPSQASTYRGPRDGIDVAGNLSREKAGYLYDGGLRELSPNLNIYGPNCDTASCSGRYMGCFPSDTLPSMLAGRFGLVWDGDSPETCTGLSGEYLKINNPHKLSLYLACGIPVFIWNQAAEAEFVKASDIGVAISNIPEALEKYRTITAERYGELSGNARAVGEKLRSGYYTLKAVARALDLLQIDGGDGI